SKGFNAQPLDLRNPLVDGWTDPDRDGYNMSSGHVRLGFQLHPRHRIETSVLSSDTTAQYDEPQFTVTPPLFFANDTATTRLRTAGASWIANWTDTYTTRVGVTDSETHYKTL